MNSNLEFQISELIQKDDKFEGSIEIYEKNYKKHIGSLSYKKYTHKIYIDHVYVDEKYRGLGFCPKMFEILIDKFPEIQIFLLANHGGVSSCKCYIKSFIDKKFDVFIGSGLFNYKFMRNNNMTIKQSKVHVKHNNNNFKKNNKTKKQKIQSLCDQYSYYSDVDFLFLRK